jgi:hypothetical protein
MKVQQDKTFDAAPVTIDDTRFIRCKFNSCTIRYSGGNYELRDCHFTADTRFEFKGSAQRTALLLHQLGMIRRDRPQGLEPDPTTVH